MHVTLRSVRRVGLRPAAASSLVALAAMGFSQSSPGGPSPSATEPAFETGVCVQFEPYQPTNFSAIASSGATMVRADLPWDETDGGFRNYNWTKTDTIYNGARGVGLKVLFILDYNNPRYGGGRYDPPLPTTARFEDYKAWVAAAVAKYPDATFEVWNEPDLVANAATGAGQFWTPTVDGAQYADLYIATYDAIKVASPNARVLFGAMANNENPGYSPTASFPWLDAALAEMKLKSALSKIEVVSYHDYPGDKVDPARSEEFTRNVRVHLDRWDGASGQNGPLANRPIWCTEVGVAQESWIVPYGEDTPYAVGGHTPSGDQASWNLLPATDFSTASGWSGYYQLAQPMTTTTGPLSGIAAFQATPLAADASAGGGRSGYLYKAPVGADYPINTYYTVSAYLRAKPNAAGDDRPQLVWIGLQDDAGYPFLATRDWRLVRFSVKATARPARLFQFFTWPDGPGFEISAPMTYVSALNDATYVARQTALVGETVQNLLRGVRDGGAAKAFVYSWQDSTYVDEHGALRVRYSSGLVTKDNLPKCPLSGLLSPATLAIR